MGSGSQSDGPMVMGGGSDGLMGMGHGSDGPMAMVLVPMGNGSRCGVFNGIVGFGLGLHQSTG